MTMAALELDPAAIRAWLSFRLGHTVMGQSSPSPTTPTTSEYDWADVCGSVWWVRHVRVHSTRVIQRLIRKRRLQAAERGVEMERTREQRRMWWQESFSRFISAT
jgi:hypothetical protein